MKACNPNPLRTAAHTAKQFFAHRRGLAARVLFFYSALLLWEGTVFIATGQGLSGLQALYVAAFSAVPALLCAALCGAAGVRAGTVLQGVLAAVGALFYGSQLVYYTVFETFYTTYSMLKGAKALGFVDVILAAMQKHWLALLCLLLPLAVLVALQIRGTWKAHRLTLAAAAKLCFTALAVQCVGIALLFAGGFTPQSAYDYYFCTNAMPTAAQRLGLYTAMRLDMARHFFGFTPVGEQLLVYGQAYVEEYQEPAQQARPEPPQTPAFASKPQVLPIDFEALAAQETNAALREMHTWFAQRIPTQTNEMTGVFKGKNLIFITAEAFSPLAVDAQRTPTLYKMMQEGFQFSNFYAPVWGVSTLDGEYVNCQGLIPKEGVWSMLESADNALPFTLGNQFKALGYETKAYHNHTYNYYSRDRSHPNLGYTYKGYGNGLNVTYQWPESDREMIELTAQDFSTELPFHIYYLTVSGHLAYNFQGGNAMATKHEQAVKDLPYSEPVRAYLACQMELDRAMELLLQKLEQAGQLENTVIALAPDHYPYGLTQQEISELLGHPVEKEFELYKSAFLLYHAGTPGKIVARPCSTLDILPTLSNLFGLPYDSRLLMGSDIFSSTEPLVMFATRSWITQEARYNAATNTLTPLQKNPLPANYVQTVSREVAQRFKMSQRILDTDYYAKVVPAPAPATQ